MGAFGSVWDGLRALGYLKPEYDQPLGNFGTVVERELDAIVEAELDTYVEDHQVVEDLRQEVEDLRQEVEDRADELKRALDIDGSELEWDALIERVKELLTENKSLTDQKAMDAAHAVCDPSSEDWAALTQRAERAEAAGQSLARESERLSRELEQVRTGQSDMAYRAAKAEGLMRTGCDELQAALGYDRLPLVGWHELLDGARRLGSPRGQAEPGPERAQAPARRRRSEVVEGSGARAQEQPGPGQAPGIAPIGPPGRRYRSQA